MVAWEVDIVSQKTFIYAKIFFVNGTAATSDLLVEESDDIIDYYPEIILQNNLGSANELHFLINSKRQ